VLIGVNLLREGLDLPEVSLVAILDADKEGFLRSERSLVQTIGRAARNVNGLVIMYADKITDSMKVTIEQTERRRMLQMKYNEEHGIVPKTIKRDKKSVFERKQLDGDYTATYQQEDKISLAADPIVQYMSKDGVKKAIDNTKAQMLKAAKEMDFMEAARLRDEMNQLEEKLKGME
jgi:excinuclease ABC subunit B